MEQEKRYQQPTLVVIRFLQADVLTFSNGAEGGETMTPGKDYDDGLGWQE